MTNDELGLGKLVERLQCLTPKFVEFVARQGEEDGEIDADDWGLCVEVRVAIHKAADAITALLAERDALAEQLRVSDLEGNHAFSLAVDDPGKNPPVLWKDRAEAAEAQLKAAREALTDIAADLQSSIDTHEFNARHMIAEDSLQDAWKMLDLARDQFQMDANSLQIPLDRARSTLNLTVKDNG